MKSRAQELLKQVGLYDRLKASSVYSLYWAFADRSVLEDRRKEIHFYRGLLNGFQPGDLIFDVGANHGSKTDIFLRLGARVLAVEPDETNQEILRGRYLKLRLMSKPVVIVPKAVSETSGKETLWIDEPGSAKNTLNRKWVDTLRTDDKRFGQQLSFAQQKTIETTTLDELISLHGMPRFVKIDVEGHEINVLRGLKRPVPYLSFEVNLPEFQQEGLQCVEVLGKLGNEGRFNYATDCRDDLLLKDWVRMQDFLPILAGCQESSIEVFWKFPVVKGN